MTYIVVTILNSLVEGHGKNYYELTGTLVTTTRISSKGTCISVRSLLIIRVHNHGTP